jgi:hypothetical protein
MLVARRAHAPCETPGIGRGLGGRSRWQAQTHSQQNTQKNCQKSLSFGCDHCSLPALTENWRASALVASYACYIIAYFVKTVMCHLSQIPL